MLNKAQLWYPGQAEGENKHFAHQLTEPYALAVCQMMWEQNFT